jgi:hypothetical protein
VIDLQAEFQFFGGERGIIRFAHDPIRENLAELK